MFDSVISSGGLTISSTLICVLVSLLLGMVIGFVHMKTSKYTKNFIVTLSVLPILVSVVMMMVNGDLGTSVAILGAFSLVRFRSMPGTSREIVSVFWAMSIGLSIGMGQIWFAILLTLIVGLFLLFLDKIGYGEKINDGKILNIVIPEDLDYENVFDDIFIKYLDKYELNRVKTTNLGSLYDLKYNIVLKNNVKEQDFINDLRIRNGNLKISVHKNEGDDML